MEQDIRPAVLIAGSDTPHSIEFEEVEISKCELCSPPAPTVLHILNNCSEALEQGRLTWRHESVNQLVSAFKLHFDEDEIICADLPRMLTSESPPATVPRNIASTTDRPDIVIVSPEKIKIQDPVCFNSVNMTAAKKKGRRKSMHHSFQTLRCLSVTYVTLKIGSLGHYTKESQKAIKSFLPDLNNFR